MVRIEIVAEGDIDLDRSARLQETFGLRHAIVIDGTGLDFHTLSEHLGEATSRLLGEILVEGDVLGLPWARSIDVMTRSLRHLPPVDVVQLIRGHGGAGRQQQRGRHRAPGGAGDGRLVVDLPRPAAARRRRRREQHPARRPRGPRPGPGRARHHGRHGHRGLGSGPLDDLRRRLARRPRGVPGGRGGGRDRRALLRRRRPAHRDRRSAVASSRSARRSSERSPRSSASCRAGPRPTAVRAALRGGLVNALVVDVVHADALLDDALLDDALLGDTTTAR